MKSQNVHEGRSHKTRYDHKDGKHSLINHSNRKDHPCQMEKLDYDLGTRKGMENNKRAR